MKSLKEIDKKLYFKVVGQIAIAIVAIAIILMYAVSSIKKAEREKVLAEQKLKAQIELLLEYQNEIDALVISNDSIVKKQLNLVKTLDSLENAQNKINEDLSKKISIINNASFSNHADWFISKLDSLRSAQITNSEL